ncbi:MAG: hypothetical protein NVS1B14_09990 [Vulcanimicrobiaceae bacterium]
MSPNLHLRAEIIAGAIALGEATDAERIEYRQHLAECVACLRALGGEHVALERVSGGIADARASELWKPDLRAPFMARLNVAPRRYARFGWSALGVGLALSLAAHFIVGSSITQMRPSLADPLVINYDGSRIVLERRSVRDAKGSPVPAPSPRMLITHNIVMLPRIPARGQSAASQRTTTKIVSRYINVPNVPQPRSGDGSLAEAQSPPNVPPWRQNKRLDSPAHRAAARPLNAARAESLAFTGVTREAEPEGGPSSISVDPARIAYQNGAEGTSAFEVFVDETGAPTKCVITKSSRWLVLDEAACKAAMRVRYRPKVSNGRAVPGVYRDAFTFHPQPTQD